MGEPDYPEIPKPDQKQFDEDYYYMEESIRRGSVMIIKNDKEEIGCLCYACFHLREHRLKLDIWLRNMECCGKRYGPQSLKLLIDYLTINPGVKKIDD